MAESISKDRLQQEIDQYVIIDVREPDELENGSIDNSQNIPLGLAIRHAKKGKLRNSKRKKYVFIVRLAIVVILPQMS